MTWPVVRCGSWLQQGARSGKPTRLAIKFTGKERDAETGLDFFEARYLSSAQGRFTSPDEFKGGGLFDAFTGQSDETIGPLPYADISDPQTLNKYAYVRNNPLRYVDPTGHCLEGIDTLICAAAAVDVVLIIKGLFDFNQASDDTQAAIDNYKKLEAQVETACISTDVNACQKALDALRSAQKRFVKSGTKLIKAGASLPGTTFSGPIPSSKEDLAIGAIFTLATPVLEHTDDNQNGKPKIDPEQPKKKDPNAPICLKDRDGNCVQ